VAVEAVILSSFIGMRQRRMMCRGMPRDHLNLQVDLSAEKEVTKPTARRSIAPAFIVTCPDCKHLFVAVLPYGLEIAH
jgi:hypothetical protein